MPRSIRSSNAGSRSRSWRPRRHRMRRWSALPARRTRGIRAEPSNIVTIHEVGRTDGGQYYIVRTRRGTDVCAGCWGQHAVRSRVSRGRQLAKALTAAHAAGSCTRHQTENVMIRHDGYQSARLWSGAHQLPKRRGRHGNSSRVTAKARSSARRKCRRNKSPAPVGAASDIFLDGRRLLRNAGRPVPLPAKPVAI